MRGAALRQALDIRSGMRRRQDAAFCFLHPPLAGAGRLTRSAAQCEPGWGDGLFTPTLLDVERPSPHLAARLARVDPPPPGEDKKKITPPTCDAARARRQ